MKSNAAGRLAETTFVHRIFGGYLRSQVSSERCDGRYSWAGTFDIPPYSYGFLPCSGCSGRPSR